MITTTAPIFAINGRPIGRGHRTFVIAEIGVNHDGDAGRALQLVRHAKAAGADAVKLQLFRAAALVHGSAAFASYQAERVADADPAAMLRRYELAPGDVEKIIAAARDAGLVPLATPFSLDDVPLIRQLQLPAVKIASPDLVNWPLLRAAAATDVPIIASTGAATMDEVQSAARWLRAWDVPFALLHCISSYPADDADANLAWIGEIAEATGAIVGYSDHAADPAAGALAVAAGACIVEKHLTHDRAARGPDHEASADPKQFAAYVRAIRNAERLLGRGGKRVLPAEMDVRRVSRQSLVLRRDVPAGHVILEDDLTTQRPGDGVPAAKWPAIIGSRISRALSAGTMLTPDMILPAGPFFPLSPCERAG